MKCDLIVVGAGGGGLATAIRGHDLGLRVAVVEALDRVGGATAFSGGQAWVGNNHLMRGRGLPDSFDEVKRYVYGIADERDFIDEPVAEQWIRESANAAEFLQRSGAIVWEIIPGYPDYFYPQVPGSKAVGRYLTAAPISGKELGSARELLLVSPHYQVGVTYAELFELFELYGQKRRLAELVAERKVEDVFTFGTAIIAHFLRGASQRGVPLLVGHRAVELVRREGEVVGVGCETASGSVTLHGSVVLATSGCDWDPELFAEYSWLQPEEAGSVAPPTIRGDGIRLARQAGANIIVLPADAIPHKPGYRSRLRGPYDSGFRSAACALPHSFMANTSGRRFCDDSFYQAVTKAVLTDRERNFPFFLIWASSITRSTGSARGRRENRIPRSWASSARRRSRGSPSAPASTPKISSRPPSGSMPMRPPVEIPTSSAANPNF